MKETRVGHAILVACAAVLFCFACTNPFFDNVKKIVDTNANGQAVPPAFTPAPNSYNSDQSIAISSATPDAVIFYTTDGSTPTASSSVYTGPILVAGPATSRTIRAFARKAGYLDSIVAWAGYVVNWSQVSTPAFSPISGSYGTNQTVYITSTSGAAIFYTLDGSTPTISSTPYNSVSGIPVTGDLTTKTIWAIATKAGMTDSAAVSAHYTINYSQASSPNFFPPNGTYAAPVSVSISSATPLAVVRYTTDGSTPTSTFGTVYSAPVNVNGSMTLKAIASAAGFSDSTVSSAGYQLPAAAPVCSPAGGTYTGTQTVTISTTTPLASIRYTTDGSNPSSTFGTVYSTPVSVDGSLTLKAIAYEAGWSDSPVIIATYKLPVAAPSFTPIGGTYSGTQTVTISTTTPLASIRYTTDGSTPTSTSGSLYSLPLMVASSVTLKAIAYEAGWSDSAVSSATYTLPVAPPVFSPGAGTYLGTQGVVISTPTFGATIRYTTDGSTPTSSTGTVYSALVNVTADTTLKAIAYESGWSDSPVMAAAYSIITTVATPVISPTGGRLGHNVPVTLSCSTPGATIVYTVDGTFPAESGGLITHGTPYTLPFILPYGDTTVTAMAFRIGYSDSAMVMSGSFTEPVFVYVGSAAGGNVTALKINLINGTPSPVGAYGVGAQVQTVAADPAGRFLFSSANLLATTSSFTINPSTGALSSVNNLAVGNTFVSAAVDATGRYLYSSTSILSGPTGYTINPSTGAITSPVTFASDGNTAGVAADPVAPYLYVALSSTGQVEGYHVNTATGQIDKIGTYTSAPGTYSVVVDPTGKFLYAGNQSGGVVTAFTINSGTGALTLNSQQPAGAPIAVAIDPTGKFLYSADYSGNKVYAFAINSVTGALSALAGSPYSDMTGPVSLSVEPSGQFLFVAHTSSTFLTIYRIGSGTGYLSGIGNYNVGVTQTSVTSTGVAQ